MLSLLEKIEGWLRETTTLTTVKSVNNAIWAPDDLFNYQIVILIHYASVMIFSALLTSRWQTSPTEWHVASALFRVRHFWTPDESDECERGCVSACHLGLGDINKHISVSNDIRLSQWWQVWNTHFIHAAIDRCAHISHTSTDSRHTQRGGSV